jgi:hypothetical protein
VISNVLQLSPNSTHGQLDEQNSIQHTHSICLAPCIGRERSSDREIRRLCAANAHRGILRRAFRHSTLLVFLAGLAVIMLELMLPATY